MKTKKYHFNELKHLEDCRVKEIVATVVASESIEYGRKKITLDNISIIKFVFQRDNFPHKPKRAKHQERVRRFH